MTLDHDAWVAIGMHAEKAFKSEDPEKGLAELRAKIYVKEHPKLAEAIIAAVRDEVVKGLKEPPPVYAQPY